MIRVRKKLFTVIFVYSLFVTMELMAQSIIENIPKFNPDFIERIKIMDKINGDYFKERNDFLAIVGSGGLGKTQIVKAYAYRNKKNYDLVWWINAAQGFEEQVVNIVNMWNKKSNKEDKIFVSTNYDVTKSKLINKLSGTSKDWLIILDNVDSIQDVREITLIENKLGKGHVLVTSRNYNEWDKMLTISKFERKESIELLSKLEESKGSQEKLNELAEILGDYPLAISQAFAFINVVPNMNVEDYISLYKTRRTELWSAENELLRTVNTKIMDGYENILYTTININVNQIKLKSEDAYDLLCLIAILDGSDIPESILLSSLNGDILKFNKALTILLSYSMIQVKSEKVEKLYSIHELPQSMVYSHLSEGEKKLSIKNGLSSLNKIIPNKNDVAFPLIVKNYFLLHQINKLLLEAEKKEIENNDFYNLYVRKLGYYLAVKKDSNASQNIIDKIDLNLLDNKSISNWIKAKYLLSKATHVRWNKGDLKTNIRLIEEAQDLLKSLPNVHEERLRVINGLVQSYMQSGENEKALQCSTEGEILISETNKELGNLDAFYGNRARIFDNIGEYEEAKNNIERALLYSKKLDIGSREIMEAPLLSYKALLLTKMNKWAEAYSLALQNKIQVNKIYEGINQEIAFINMIIAHCLHHQNKIAKAEDEITSALNMYNKLYPKQKGGNRSHAFAYMIYGNIKNSKKEYKEAHKAYLESEEIYNKVLQNKKIKDVSALYTAITKNCIDMKEVNLAKKYRNKHEDIFGMSDKNSMHINFYIERNIVLD